MARRLEAGLPTTHIHIRDPPYIRLCLNLTTPHLAALEPTSTSTTPAGMTSLATPATPTRAALAKEEHGEARWSSGRYALAQAEARRKEAQRLRVRVAEEGARRGVQLGPWFTMSLEISRYTRYFGFIGGVRYLFYRPKLIF